MTNETILTTLQSHFGETTFTNVEEQYGLLSVTIERTRLLDVMHFLRESDLGFSFLTTMCGIHYPQQLNRELGMVYHLHNLPANVRLRVKTFFPILDPVVPTLTNIWATANWMEREAFDFYGIIFTGHPNLIRILNVEDMAYHPMRREYPLEDQTREDKTDSFFGR
jgi:NADH-quinone oxidoreductase subunit C